MGRSGWTLAILLCLATQGASGYTKEELQNIPENKRFAANIENNFVVGGFRNVLNWTSHTLGKPPGSILRQCTKPTYQGERLCMKVPMPTPWSSSVDPEAPLPDYPRPQLKRNHWLSLNGIWSFKSRGVREMQADWDDTPEQRIVVPYPVESPLSGIANHDANNVQMRYKRTFKVPTAWHGQSVLLHFDAVDHTATVHLNGHKVGSHEGGYDRFSFDVTEHLKGGENEIIVEVFDPTEFAHIPIGKQRLHPPRHPSGIWYTSTSGIWQTVWLEPVPEAHIGSLQMVPDIDAKALHLTVHGSQGAKGASIKAIVLANGKQIASAEGSVGKDIEIPIAEPQLWSPDSPFLYDLDISLQVPASKEQGAGSEAGKHSERTGINSSALKTQQLPGRRLAATSVTSLLDRWFTTSGRDGRSFRGLRDDDSDRVSSYFAMRKSSLGRAPDGGLRPLLNNEFVFQTGMLDQGFWPDGIYTPASDEALVSDLELTKELGYNMLRKHTKVESDRWYYHADRLGILVWQDMPSMFYQSGAQDLSLKDKMQFKIELQHIMQQHFNSPCIVAWVIFNEGWGQHDTLEVVKFAQKLDSSRLLDAASGWVDRPVGSFVDKHQYVGPGSPLPTANRAAVLGEYGGLGLRTEEPKVCTKARSIQKASSSCAKHTCVLYAGKLDGHMWIPDDAFAYEMQLTGKQLQDRYVGLVQKIEELMVDPEFHLSAAVYTGVSDVEAEINGWITYDRQVKKVDPKVLFKANQQLIKRSRSAGQMRNSSSVAGKERTRSANILKLKKTVGKSKAKVFNSMQRMHAFT